MSEEQSPLGVTGHRILCVGDAGIVVIGGWNPRFTDDTAYQDRHYVRSVWSWSFSGGRWRQLNTGEDAPVPLASHGAVLLGSDALVTGGSLSPLGVPGNSNEVWLLHLDGRPVTWELKSCGGSPPVVFNGHWFGRATFLDRETSPPVLYVVSGRCDEGELEVHQLDTGSWSWSKLRTRGPSPEPRCRHEIFVHKGLLYVLGGTEDFGSRSCFPLDPTYVLDTRTLEWTARSGLADGRTGALPCSRMCFGLALCQDSAYVYGGLSQRPEWDVCLEDLWRLDLPGLQWTKMSVALPPRWFHAVDVTPTGCLVSFGGCVSSSYHSERSRAVVSVWVRVPSLERISWEKLLKASAHKLRLLSDQQLKLVGIPRKYIELLRF